jgi:hypothetical protein
MVMMRKLSWTGRLFFLLFCFSGPVFPLPPQGPPPRGTETAQPGPREIPRIEGRIAVDGRLEEAAWRQALVLDLPFETDPGENIPALVKTTVRVFYDKDNIYFALECFDPDPSQIRSRFAERDQIDADDLININLDTFNDERRNYFLGCNPLGVQRDGLETVGGDISWDAIWASAGRIHEQGYTVEIAIPFSSLQFQRTGGSQVWGLDISRWYPRSQRHRLGLVKMDRNNNSYQNQFMKILPAGDFANVTRKLDPGVTLKWGATANLTFSGTVNPDFSQVEADSRQLDVNQPFALFYQEKRPFFTEGADFFSSPFRVIYTRTLRDPLWGLKLSGKEGGNTVGAYYVLDDLTNLIFPGSQGSGSTSLDQRSSALVLRYKRDLGTNYTLGALFTDRSGGNYFNRLLGFDGQARFTNRDKISFQFLGSSTLYPESVVGAYSQPATAFNDKALLLEYDHQARNLNFWIAYEDVGDLFRADLGFMPQVDYRDLSGAVSYNWIRNRGWWSLLQVGTSFSYSEDQESRFLYRRNSLSFYFRGALQTYFTFYANHTLKSYQDKTFDLWSGQAYLQMQPVANLRFYLNSNFGDSIDYENVRPGRRVQVNPALTINVGRRLAFSLDHNYERMKVDGRELYTANISQGQAIYHLNARTFLRAIVQYVAYDYNVANYTFTIDPEYKHFFSQFLFSYKLNPRTVLFLGYSDNAQGNQDYRLARSDRTVFMKVGYSWQI